MFLSPFACRLLESSWVGNQSFKTHQTQTGCPSPTVSDRLDQTLGVPFLDYLELAAHKPSPCGDLVYRTVQSSSMPEADPALVAILFSESL